MTAPLSGVVLAGGASRRMGQDKAGLELDGATLLARAVSCLRRISDDVIVASGDGRRLPGEWRQVADAWPESGPLGGLVPALEAAGHDLTAVLAVDLAAPSPALLAWLAARWDGGSWAVVPEAQGRLQPLHAVYRSGAAPQLRQHLERGERSLTRLLEADPQGVQRFAPSAYAHVADPGFATNLNTPEDLRAAGSPERHDS